MKNTTYTEEFDWDEIKPETEKEVDELVDIINDEIDTIREENKLQRNPGASKLVKRPLKRKKEVSDDDDVDEYADEGLGDIDEDEVLDDNESDGFGEINRTPRKKKKHTKTMTPRKPRTPSKLLTPSHKR